MPKSQAISTANNLNAKSCHSDQLPYVDADFRERFAFAIELRGAVQHGGVRPYGRAGGQGGQAGLKGAPEYALARLRFRASE